MFVHEYLNRVYYQLVLKLYYHMYSEKYYPDYHKTGFSLLRPGGIGVLDNMLWSGSVLDPSDDDARALRETAELIKNNDRLEPLLIPIRDGVMVYRKSY